MTKPTNGGLESVQMKCTDGRVKTIRVGEEHEARLHGRPGFRYKLLKIINETTIVVKDMATGENWKMEDFNG